jgi:dipeptidyl aminopeptidase/acylaminoacyl peptidase
MQFTSAGDTALPRLASPSRHKLVLATPAGGASQLVVIEPFKGGATTAVVGGDGAANPAIALSGSAVAWDTTTDPALSGLPGRQVVRSFAKGLATISNDPTGTSSNPTLDTSGRRVAFESTADLTNAGNPGVRRIYVRDGDGPVLLASSGLGTSRNPVAAPRGFLLVWESTSDPDTGADAGIAQIWVGSLLGTPGSPITAGAGPSRNPAVSDDGRLIAFESTADLAGDQHDTGVPQIFVHDVKTRTTAQVTFDADGCTLPAVQKVRRDWRVAFVCGGQADFFMLRADQRFRVPVNGGTVQRVVPQLGIHFLTLSTTGNLLQGGVTAGKQVYMVNLYKRPADPVATPPAVWFPFRGIGPL